MHLSFAQLNLPELNLQPVRCIACKFEIMTSLDAVLAHSLIVHNSLVSHTTKH